jgi:hypothetical protein
MTREPGFKYHQPRLDLGKKLMEDKNAKQVVEEAMRFLIKRPSRK